MEPNSPTLLVIVAVIVLAALYAVIRLRHLAIRLASAVVVVAVSMAGGMVVVNDYYGYYQTWSQL
ncbi:MAG: hypothetical protein ACRDVG_06690, partial [Jatrophihabitantaceae bacterium]